MAPAYRVRKRLIAGWIFLIATILPVTLQAEELIRHELKVVLQPQKNHLEVSDTITLPPSLLAASAGPLHFLLHSGLQPVSPTAGVRLKRQTDPKQSGAGPPRPNEPIATEYYTVSLPPGQYVLVIQYRGRIYHPVEPAEPAFARRLDETPGLISGQGIFLSGSTLWVPLFDDDRVTFTLDVRLPEPWEAISQGDRTRHERKGGWVEARWESPEPQDEIYLIAGRWTEYSRASDDIKVMAFLRKPDEKLARTYLETGIAYLKMYQDLLGPYPYKKFALVENFWETGYGMPSFTLLGSAVIRLPFIPYSSYPHEILHNWWGNGVLVHYEKGNWSEGLTAYLADHLIQEQRGSAAEYRRATLQKYADYVTGSQDFPVTEFRARHNSATEAVGYGKTMMFFHMLRRRIGDEAFINALKQFYRANRFRRADFDDLRTAFTTASGEDLQAEFAQWVSRSGAPALRVNQVAARKEAQGYLLTALLEQVQPGPTYALRVPMTVHLEGEEKAYQTVVAMDSKRLDLTLPLPARPFRLEIDPEFDLFRRLDRNELPPALTQSFGAEKALILIPADADEALRRGYRQLAESYQRSSSYPVEIKLDMEMSDLPSDRAVYLFGWENRFLPNMKTALAGYALTATQDGFRIGETDITRKSHSIVLTARHPENPNASLTWVATDTAAALPGLWRKLPHYGKYSYLAFEGEEPTNIFKGQWDVPNSPLSVLIPGEDGRVIPNRHAKPEPRRALADPPSD